MTAAELNRLLAAGADRAEHLTFRLAKLLEPILIAAGREAARNFERRATNHLTAAAPGVTASSTMVCLMPRPEEAATIAQEAALPADTLHVTLCYLGELEGPLAALEDTLRAVAAAHAPLEGVVGGHGMFTPDPETGQGPAILLPDVPGLSELRVAVTEALRNAGVEYARNHGFLPHITVQYAEPGADTGPPPFGEPLHFDALCLVRGDQMEAELPLIGPPPVTAAAGWTPPYPDELIDTEALIAKLRGKTDPVRLAAIEAMMSESLAAVGQTWDPRNPFARAALEQAASQVTNIVATTRDNVNRVIRASYEQGFTIPDTAKAIRRGMRDAAGPRAELIARTELVGAVNAGSLAAARTVASAGGPQLYKQWLTAPGAKHPRHYLYDGLNLQTRPLNGTFDVGGSSLDHPGDPNGPPHEVCNCRCAMIYTEQPPTADTIIVPGLGEVPVGVPAPKLALEPAKTVPGLKYDFVPDEYYDLEEYQLASRLTNDFADLYRRDLTRKDLDAAVDYRAESYQEVNRYARTGEGPRPGETDPRDTLQTLDAAIGKVPGLPEQAMFYRGVSSIEEIIGGPPAVGATFTDQAFGSFSQARFVAEQFASKQGVILEAELPAGSRGLWAEAVDVARGDAARVREYYAGGEESQGWEWIAARGNRYEVTGVRLDAKGRTVVTVRQVESVPAAPEPAVLNPVDEIRQAVAGYTHLTDDELHSVMTSEARMPLLRVNGYAGPALEEREAALRTLGGKIVSEVERRLAAAKTEDPAKLKSLYKRRQTAYRKRQMAVFDELAKAEDALMAERHPGRSLGSLDDQQYDALKAAVEAHPDVVAAQAKLERALTLMREAEDRLTGADGRLAAARRDHVLDVLGEVRPMGGDLNAGTGSEPTSTRLAQLAANLLPRAWVEASNNFRRPLYIDWADNGRGFYQHHIGSEWRGRALPAGDSSGLFLVGRRGIIGTDPAGLTNAVHELAHRFEYVVPELRFLEWVFHSRRTVLSPNPADHDLAKLVDLEPGSGYGLHETTYPDKFTDPYIGKTYGSTPGSSGEVLSMGLEGVLNGQHNIWDGDPELRDFILGLLAAL